MTKVFLNPGHMPGVDPGAVNTDYGVEEAVIALDVGERTQEYLEAAGCEVKLLQSHNLSGESPAYPNICRTANQWGADIFVSLHCNAATPAAEGTETLVYSHWSKAERLAACIQKQLVSSLGTVDRGIKERPGLAVLRETNMPAALAEMAFISNPGDVELLINKKDEIACAIARGITDYLQEQE